jgi:hypothetical protein
MNDFIPIRVYFEKIYGRGEDAEPLLEIFDKFGFIKKKKKKIKKKNKKKKKN